MRCAFLLVVLDRYSEALPILEEIHSPSDYKSGVPYYLGCCYLAQHDFEKARRKLTEALKIGLPYFLERRAHWDLGISHFELGEYTEVKLEFEKFVEKAPPSSVKTTNVWEWLRTTCAQLGLREEAEHYRLPSGPSS